eukprot:scaffold6262_cov250-Ochromonas_danica.AAC.1
MGQRKTTAFDAPSSSRRSWVGPVKLTIPLNHTPQRDQHKNHSIFDNYSTTEPLYFFKTFGILYSLSTSSFNISFNEHVSRKSLKRKQLLREEERTSRRRIAPGIDMAEWRLVDPTIESFEIDEPPSDLTAIVLNMRHGTLSSIFLKFLSIDLLTAIWNEKRNGDWTYHHNGCKTINHGYFPKNLKMKFLAVKVRLFGLHHVPLEHEEHGRPLREDITEAIHHFKESFPNVDPPPGILIILVNLTPSILQKVKNEEGFENFQQKNKPKELLKLLKEKVLAAGDNTGAALRQRWQNINQNDQDLETFLVEFNGYLELLKGTPSERKINSKLSLKP